MARLIWMALISVCLCGGSLPYIGTDLLPSDKEMEVRFKEFSEIVDKKLSIFVLSSQDKKFNEAYDAWCDVCSAFYDSQFTYYEVITLSANLISKGYAGSYVLDLHQEFRKHLKEKCILDVFVANGLQAGLLTPYQRFITEKVVGGATNRNDESWEKLFQYERANFIYEQFLPLKSVSIANRFKVLTANVICFPDQFSYFFGGVSPWPNRIDKIAEKIIGTNADIVCLQEVWDRSVGKALVLKLKKDYSYFVYDAGNQYGTLSPEEIGLNSGLFIASKLPLETLSFIPFAKMKPKISGIKRGAIRVKISLGDKKLTIVATHLQSGHDDDEEQIRKDELAECVGFLGNDPGFIIGDLNINAFSNEYLTSVLPKNFLIPYLHGKSSVNKNTATATDYFNDLTHTVPADRGVIKPTYELLDYCAVSKNIMGMKLIGQERVLLFSIKDPCRALSDHHGIITSWQIK